MESVNDMRIKNGLMLLLTAFIWGTAFVAQSVGMDYLEPFTFNGVRSLIGGSGTFAMYLDLAEIKWKIERYRHEKGSAHGRIGLWCVTVCGKQSSADRY